MTVTESTKPLITLFRAWAHGGKKPTQREIEEGISVPIIPGLISKGVDWTSTTLWSCVPFSITMTFKEDEVSLNLLATCGLLYHTIDKLIVWQEKRLKPQRWTFV